MTRPDSPGYELIFDNIDVFMPQVEEAVALRDALSPATLIDMDEAGVILPDDNFSRGRELYRGFRHSTGTQ